MYPKNLPYPLPWCLNCFVDVDRGRPKKDEVRAKLKIPKKTKLYSAPFADEEEDADSLMPKEYRKRKLKWVQQNFRNIIRNKHTWVQRWAGVRAERLHYQNKHFSFLVSYNGKSDWIGKETNFNNWLFFQASSHQPLSVEVFAAVR
jgi:hypothetical protein